MERSRFIDLARGITIICVVFFHSAARTHPSIYYYDSIQLPIKLVYSFIMPFFFMVSAVFARKRLENVNISKKAFLKYISSSILKPFYTISLLFFLIKIALPRSLNVPSAQEMIKGMLFLQSYQEILPTGVLWFLFVLFACSFITFIFIKIFKMNVYVVFIFSIILKLSNPALFYQNHFFAIDLISYYYIFYTSGYVLSEQVISSSIFSRNVPVYFFCWITAFYITDIINPLHLMKYIISFVGIFGSLFILDLSYKFNIRFPSGGVFLRYCGKNSLLIYVFHTPGVILMRSVIYRLNLFDSIWGLALVVLCGTFLPLAIGKLLSYNASIYELLLGRKP